MFACTSRASTLLPLLCLLALLGACGRESSEPAASAAFPADPLAQAAGEWLLINYWAEWCKPCTEEIPQLNDFAERHAGKARVLMVNFDGIAGEPLRAQAAQLGIRTELLEQDPAARFGFERPQALPATFLIAPDGRLRTVLLGPQDIAGLERATGLGAP